MSRGWTSGRTCDVPRCGAKHHAKGVCRRHRAQVLRLGHVIPFIPNSTQVLEVDRIPFIPIREVRARGEPCYCRKKHHARGLCRKHYWLARRPRRKITRGCAALGCRKKHHAKGLCAEHYVRRRYAAGWRQKRAVTA